MEKTIARRDAHVGDVIVVDGHTVGEPARLGEILELLGDPATPHFRVRWEDDHETIFYPGHDVTVRRAHRR